MEKSPAHRREQILEQAEHLFLTQGIAQVTTRDIARAVGISQPSLYAHFPTRDAIAVELCRRAFEALHARLLAATQRGGTLTERLERLSREYIAFGLAHPPAYRVAFMLDLEKHGSAEKQVVVAAGVRAFGVLQALMAETRHPDCAMAAQSAWASMHGLVSLLLARQDFPWADRNALIDLHVTGLCRAVLSGAEGGG